MKIKSIIILLLVGISFTNWNCGLVSDILDGDDNPAQYAISASSYNVTPFETITLTIDEYIFSEDSYYGEIYDKEVQLIKTSPTQLTFMMPYIPEGERILEFILEDVTHDLTFTILTLDEIDNPDEIIITYKDNVVEAFNELKNMNQLYNLEIEPQNLQVIEKYLSDFNNAYTSATEEEKQELAQFMNTNPDLFDFSNFDYSFFNDSLNTRDFVNWDERITEDMRYFTGLVIATGATVVLFNGALISLNPFAIAITGAALLTEVVLLKRQTKTILNRSYKPFEFDINNELRSGVVEFENNIEYQLGIDATYRSLYKNDQNSSDVTIELVATINTVTGYWNQVLENIPGTTGSVINLNDKNSYNINTNRSVVTSKHISIENVSNSNVKKEGFSNTNIVKVKFTTTADEDQNFSFDIVYKNPDFSEERVTVHAKLVVEVFNYALQIGDYNPDYTLINVVSTLNEGDYISLPNYMKQMVRLTLDGVPVKVGEHGLDWTSFRFGTVPASEDDIYDSEYMVSVFDATNYRNVNIKLEVSLTNDAYRTFVGNTILCDRGSYGDPNGTPKTINLNSNGTYTVKHFDGSDAGSGTYSFVDVISPSFVTCSSYNIIKPKFGSIRLSGGQSGGAFYPEYIMLYDDFSMSANSFYGCNDRYQTWHLY